MITNATHAPDVIDYHRHVQRLEREQPLRTCLGTGCCPQCGAPWSLTERGAVRNAWGCWCVRKRA